jgi:hypothetical protein
MSRWIHSKELRETVKYMGAIRDMLPESLSFVNFMDATIEEKQKILLSLQADPCLRLISMYQELVNRRICEW